MANATRPTSPASTTHPPAAPPTRQLYPFQDDGVEFLTRRKKWGRGYRGGFLWDDPGLGKTTQAIVAAVQLDKFPILVVCPNSLKLHWAREIRLILPGAKVTVATVGGRWRKWSKAAGKSLELTPTAARLSALNADWVVVHYAGLRVSETAYASIPWATVIGDELHYIKNRKARRTKALMTVTPDGANRIGLTATPYSKEPSGLWSQMHWMAPRVEGLSNYWRWFGIFTEFKMETLPNGRRYRKVIGGKNLDTLAKVMATYGVCRRKDQVAPQLPPITDTVMPLELSGRQAKVYEALEDSSRSELAIGHTDTQGALTGPVTGMVIKNVLSRLTKMERWLSNPTAMDPGTVGVKMEWLREWSASFEHPAVIVTRFKSTAKAIARELGVPVITGDVPMKLRDPIIEGWRLGGPEAPQYLVGTIHTLGTGLNLERAYTLICYDQVYSPILMTQVRERIHRITSEHRVEVIYLVIQGTSNELVYESFTRKWRELELVKRFIRMLRSHSKDWRTEEEAVQ